MRYSIYMMKISGIAGLLFMSLCFVDCNKTDFKKDYSSGSLFFAKVNKDSIPADVISGKDSIQFDTAVYNSKLLNLVHNKPSFKWPVKTSYPLPSAILPFKRIVAYYGNFYSKNMGILGELPPDQMLEKLLDEVENWKKADTLTPVLPALHYIAVTAQSLPGANGKYRLRMPFSQIDKVLELANKIDAIVFLDIQVGWSTLPEEIPVLEKYLRLPNVHLGIDPEYSMKGGEKPCATIGTFDAADINYASEYLSKLVQLYHLPPKILVIHRFTKGMVTNYENIITHPEVQIVMNMDGFGFPAKKIDSYKMAIANEPVQFTGFKVFYKNDTFTPGWKTIMQPAEILNLYPSPVYIQYQ
jgi:hypothetical protein